MPERPNPPYHRLPGTGYKRIVPGWVLVLLFFVIGILVLLLRGRRVQLWTGDDHLLLVESDGHKEYYKRFFYRDIQALILRRTWEGRIINILLSLPAALFAFFAMTTSDPDGQIALAIIAGLFAFLLVINFLSGPTCQCQLRTAVNLTDLPSLTRVRQARKAFARVRPLIVATQGEVASEEVQSRILQFATGGTTTSGAQLIVDDPNLPPRMLG